MPSSISVQPGQVSQLSANIMKGADDIQSDLNDLDQKVNKLIGSWEGDAQEAYRSAQSKWTQQVTDIRNLLNQIGSATDQISQQYTSTDHSSANLFG